MLPEHAPRAIFQMPLAAMHVPMPVWMHRACAGFAAGCACLAFVAKAQAQVTPSRLYFGVDRPVPMTVHLPEGTADTARLLLFDAPKSGEGSSPVPASKAVVKAGTIDLAQLFPELWTSQNYKVRYVQLAVGEGESEKRIGPAVVLQPMTAPPQAMLIHPQTREVWYTDPATSEPTFPVKDAQIVWTSPPPQYAGLRADIDKHAVLDTSMGEIEFRLRPDSAPNTVNNFRALVDGGFYTDIIFHRIVATLADGSAFVVQVGDPTGTGDGGPGYNLALEASSLPHDFGVLSMARDSTPDTAGSQVFICLSREGTQRLDGKYTAFAQAVRGAEVIHAIAKVRVNGQRPEDPPVLRSAKLIDAPPFGTGPEPVIKPEAKPTKR